MNFLDGACHVLWQAGRWRAYSYDQLLDPDIIAQDIVADLEQFQLIAADLEETV